jgi:hypothetical protein
VIDAPSSICPVGRWSLPGRPTAWSRWKRPSLIPTRPPFCGPPTPSNARCSAPTHRRRPPHNRSAVWVPPGELHGSCCLDIEAFLPAAIPYATSSRTTAPCPASSLTRIDTVPSEVVAGLVSWCGWHGMQALTPLPGRRWLAHPRLRADARADGRSRCSGVLEADRWCVAPEQSVGACGLLRCEQ